MSFIKLNRLFPAVLCFLILFSACQIFDDVSAKKVYAYKNSDDLIAILLSQKTTFDIPTLDLSSQTKRQIVVEKGTEELYNGHPTTVLLPDNKTIYCVWTIDHGGPCGPIKRSTDGGLTWSPLLKVPSNWTDVKNCPSIYHFTDPETELSRLFVFASTGPDGKMHQSFSSDEGNTWSEMKSNGLDCIMPFCSVIPVEGGEKLLAMTNINLNDDKSTSIVAKSYSTDGGFTWGSWNYIVKYYMLKPSEPEIIRSPTGDQLLCIMRENVYRISLYMTSDDEGRTWSDVKPLSPSLFGDRHKAKYAPDGRLVIAFRDTGEDSPTKDHFVCWVGEYQDILDGNEGQYRIKLLHSHGGNDCGYPGLELLPDSTFVATTYIKYRQGTNKNSIVSKRFKLSETDSLLLK